MVEIMMLMDVLYGCEYEWCMCWREFQGEVLVMGSSSVRIDVGMSY